MLRILAGFDSCCLAVYLCLSQAYFLGTAVSIYPLHLNIFAQKGYSVTLAKTMNPGLLAAPTVTGLAEAGIWLWPARFLLRLNMYKYPL